MILNYKKFTEAFVNNKGEIEKFSLPDTEDEFQELVWSSDEFKKNVDYLLSTGKIDMLNNAFNILSESKKKILLDILYTNYDMYLFSFASADVIDYCLKTNKHQFYQKLKDSVKDNFTGELHVSTVVLDRIPNNIQKDIFEIMLSLTDNNEKILLTEEQVRSFNLEIQETIKKETPTVFYILN